MTDPKRRGPRQPAQSPKGQIQYLKPQYNRLPPYARALDPGRRTLWVLTGNEAWEWAKGEAWMPGAKVVLPPGEHPSAYRWSFSKSFQDAVIVAAGHPPPFDVIAALAGYLLAHLDLVLYLDHRGRSIRLNPARRAA